MYFGGGEAKIQSVTKSGLSLVWKWERAGAATWGSVGRVGGLSEAEGQLQVTGPGLQLLLPVLNSKCSLLTLNCSPCPFRSRKKEAL